MTQRTTPWPAGTPCWVDMMVPDVAKSAAFYSELLGWQTRESSGDRDYTMGLVDDSPVAGLLPSMPGTADSPKAWVVYLATDDLERTDRLAVEHGATQVVAPMAVGTAGSMGLWIDPWGASFAAWQAGDLPGQCAYDVVGAPMWMDLMATDVEAVSQFYGEVFPLSFADSDELDMTYLMFTPDGAERPAGGIGRAPEGEASGWSVCFAVADADATAARVADLGGRLVEEPFDFAFGRMAVLAGPDGELFTVMSASSGGDTQA